MPNRLGKYIRLVSNIQDEHGEWSPLKNVPINEKTAVSPTIAQSILDALSQSNSILEFSTLVLSGPDGTTNTWYLGASPSGERIVIVLENHTDLEEIEEMGRALLTAKP